MSNLKVQIEDRIERLTKATDNPLNQWRHRAMTDMISECRWVIQQLDNYEAEFSQREAAIRDECSKNLTLERDSKEVAQKELEQAMEVIAMYRGDSGVDYEDLKLFLRGNDQLKSQIIELEAENKSLNHSLNMENQFAKLYSIDEHQVLVTIFDSDRYDLETNEKQTNFELTETTGNSTKLINRTEKFDTKEDRDCSFEAYQLYDAIKFLKTNALIDEKDHLQP